MDQHGKNYKIINKMIKTIRTQNVMIDGNIKTINSILLTNLSGYDFTADCKPKIEYAIGFKNEENEFISYQNASIDIPIMDGVLDSNTKNNEAIANYIISERSY